MSKAAGKSKLMLIAPYFAPRNYGGAVQIYDGLLRRLTRLDAIVLGERQDADETKLADFDAAAPAQHGYSVKRVERLVLHFKRRSRFMRVLEMLRFLNGTRRAFERELREAQPRVVICGATFSAGWLMASVPRNVARVNYIHGEELTMRRDSGPLDRWLIRGQLRALREADLNIVVSRYSAETLQRIAQVPAQRVQIFPNAVDTDTFKPPDNRGATRRSLGWEGHTVLLTVARLIARKGIDQVLRALAERHQNGELPANWMYVIGGNGPEKEPLRQLAASLHISERVRFSGFIANDQLSDWYGAADLFVLTNREIAGDTEGFGIVFLEANACGTPVIGGIAGGTGDAIEEGVSGLRVDGEKVSTIGEALARLLGDESARRAMGEAGLVRVREEFSLGARARQFEDMMLKLAAGTPK